MRRTYVTRKTKEKGQAQVGLITILQKGGKVSQKAIGQAGESAAAYYLKSKGYRIIGRNIRLKRGEADILALKDDIIRLVEVKTSLFKREYLPLDRSKKSNEYIDPEANFTAKKISRLKSIASELMSKYPFPLLHMLDFDIKPGYEGLVLKDAGEVQVYIEGVAVRIYVNDGTIKNVRVRHFENLVS